MKLSRERIMAHIATSVAKGRNWGQFAHPDTTKYFIKHMTLVDMRTRQLLGWLRHMYPKATIQQQVYHSVEDYHEHLVTHRLCAPDVVFGCTDGKSHEDPAVSNFHEVCSGALFCNTAVRGTMLCMNRRGRPVIEKVTALF